MNMTTGRRGIVWKTPDITADGLKMFACITMLIQTVGIAIIEKGLIHLDQYTQESLNQAMSQDSRLMTLAGVGSIMQLIGGNRFHHAAYRRDGDSRICVSAGRGIS